MADKKGDYEVGYGKPPRNTRFKKGQSGNPRGRAPGVKNLKTLLIDTLNEPVVVTENGGRRTISKRQAIIKQLVNHRPRAIGAPSNCCSTCCTRPKAAANLKPRRAHSARPISKSSSS
jgi:hypothetical protein